MGVLGWALLNHSSQTGQPARNVDQGYPQCQKARPGSLSSRGRPGEAPREAGFLVITGSRPCSAGSTACRRGLCHGAWASAHPG